LKINQIPFLKIFYGAMLNPWPHKFLTSSYNPPKNSPLLGTWLVIKELKIYISYMEIRFFEERGK